MKRIIAVILCLCLVLTGCQNKKTGEETNEASNPTVQTQPTQAAETGTDSNNETNPTAKLLKLNQAWSLVQNATPELPSYDMPDYKAEVKPYTIASDLSNIENINQFAGFTKEQTDMLVNKGFVVLPAMSTRIYYVYDDNEYKGVPNFVTSDTALHLYHQFYDKSLMSIESNYLYQDLELMTKQMLQKSIQLEQDLTDAELKTIQQKNIIYFMVARMLFLQTDNLGKEVGAEYGTLIAIAKQEYALAQAAEGITESPLFGKAMDYSQFTVRGHYTRSEELSRYFRTMMWFGYSPVGLMTDKNEIIYDNVYQALLIAFTTIADSETVPDAQLWSDIYQPTAIYVGLSDDINVFTMNGLRLNVFGEDENPDIYNDAEYQNSLSDAVKALPEPQIKGKIKYTDQVTAKQFRFMGQRYTLDADILQTLIDPDYRPIPTSLDVMGVLGSRTAEDLLMNNYKPQTSWPDYTEKYNGLKSEVGKLSPDFWQKNLYTGWLSALKDAMAEYGPDSGMPFFMTNEAWRNKSLNTALSSYAELKHDTVLYGKQAMAEMGGPVATSDLHYVEPDVELYYQLLYLTESTCKILDEKGMLNVQLKNGADTYKEFLNLLISCSVKELKNEPLTEEENQKLLWCGGTIENIMTNFLQGASGDDMAKDATDMLITDITTAGNQYLSIGTGYFDDIYVVIPYEGKLYLSKGSVYSFYEFVSTERLTDEAWWGLQGINVVHNDFGDFTEFGELSADLPKQPDWIHNFKSDSNDVIITSLEVLWGLLEE